MSMVSGYRKWRDSPILICLIALGFGLRVWGINFGLPYEYHPDEPLPVYTALAMGYTHDLNPHWFIHPSLLFYSLLFLYGIYFLVGLLVGMWSDAQSFAISVLRNPTGLYLIGRFLSAIASTSVIPLVYLIGKKMYNRRTGLFAAILFTPLYLPNYFGHFIKPESLQTLLTAVAFFFILCMFETGRVLHYILAGFFIGLSTATKYPSGLLIFSLFIAHFLRSDKKNFLKSLINYKLSLSLASSFLGFAIGAPFCILNFHAFVKAFFEIKFYTLPALGASYAHIIHDWISNLRHDIGNVPLLLFTIGTIFALFRFSKKNIILLIFPVTHFVLFSLPAWKNIHWQMVTLPFFVNLAAYFLNSMYLKLTRMPTLIRKGLLSIIIVSFTLGPLMRVMNHDRLLSRTDTRTLAKEWIEKYIPAGTKIAMERGRFFSHFSPPVRMNAASIRRLYLDPHSPFVTKGYRIEHLKKYYEFLIKANEEPTYDITPIVFDPWAGQMSFYERPRPMTFEYYKLEGIQYFIITHKLEKFATVNPRNKAEEEFIQSYRRLYNELKKQAILVKEFHPADNPGPHIYIFRLSN